MAVSEGIPTAHLLVVVPQGLVAVVGLVHDDVNGLLRGDVGGQSAVLQGLPPPPHHVTAAPFKLLLMPRSSAAARH